MLLYSRIDILHLPRLQQTPVKELSVNELLPAQVLILRAPGNTNWHAVDVRRQPAMRLASPQVLGHIDRLLFQGDFEFHHDIVDGG